MQSRIIYVATSNLGKLQDFAAAVGAASSLTHEFTIEPLPCLDRIPAPPENEVTFEGNACTKAIYYSRLAHGFNVIADDSGLEVHALDGSPGVRSARYAADHGFRSSGDADQDNNLLLLQSLATVDQLKRSARYRCVLALARDGEIVVTAHGAVEGTILTEARGRGGFGYDPLFYLPRLGKTMAEIDLETKNAISHRGRALQILLQRLTESQAS